MSNTFRATEAFLQGLWSQFESLAEEIENEGDKTPARQIYARLVALNRNAKTITLTRDERDELANELYSIRTSLSLTPGEVRAVKAAEKQLKAWAEEFSPPEKPVCPDARKWLGIKRMAA